MSSHWKNPACIEYSSTSRPHISIFVKQFLFSGPNKFTYPHLGHCQYGGLFLEIDDTERYFEFCRDMNDFMIGSENKGIYITLIWFTGYSIGSLLGRLSPTMCRTVYVETFPREMLFQPDVLVKVNISVACQYIVCPSLQREKQDIFFV